MRRREIYSTLLAAAGGLAFVSRRAEAQTCAPPCYPQTAAEAAAGLVPENSIYPPGDFRRMDPDPSGTTPATEKLQKMLDAAGLASNGDVSEVVVPPGLYKVTRLYIRHSNVWLKLMPGAILQQTRAGIADANTSGAQPATAVIHIHPQNYTLSPTTAITPLDNVKIYGGGTIKGPYTTPSGSYDAFSMGVVSNDCNRCVIDGIKVMNCRSENILLNPSAWNTCTGLKIINCEVEGGGEVAVNNGRGFEVSRNYVHDSWIQNGVGGNGDGGVVADNIIRGMYQGGMTVGGSGARDINECRNVLYARNVIINTGAGNPGYALFLSDDGATTTPKRNLKFTGNVIQLHNGQAVVAADYADNRGIIDFDGNTITGGSNASGCVAFAVIAGSATYNLRNNTIYPGTGNQNQGIAVLGGTPLVNVFPGNHITGHAIADIQASAHIKLSPGLPLHSGAGTPEGNLSAPVGHVYLRTDGSASTTLYVKESGSGSTGWVAK